MRKSSSTAITTQPKEALGELANSEWLGDRLLVWASQNLRDFSWRRTTDPYSIFIAEFLLQKTGAATAELVYQKFIARYPTLLSLAEAPLEDIAELVAPQTDVSRWNLTLLDFGAMVCTAKNPHCTDCPLQERCNYNLLGGRN